MNNQKIRAGYIIRLYEQTNKQKDFQILNLKTGEQTNFTTWISAWVWLEQEFANQSSQ